MKKILAWMLMVFSFVFVSIGYAQVTDELTLMGSADVTGSSFDVYISSMTPLETSSMRIKEYIGTTFSASVNSSGSSVITVKVRNQSEKIYVFERVIDGAEMDIEGVYNGDDITYTLDGLVFLQELAPGEEITFTTTITVPKNVTTDYYMLRYNFIEKTDTGVLPGNPDPIYYTVTFSGADVPAQTVLQNTTATEPPEPQRDGYVFAGWNLGDEHYHFDTPVTSDITLEAVWVEDAPDAVYYTVTFSGADVPAQTVLAGTKVTRPPDPTRLHYGFVAWYLGDDIYDFDLPVTSDITLEAVWVYANPEVYYTVTFSGADVPSQIVLKGTLATKPPTPTRNGYVFDGWYLGNNLYTFTDGVMSDITLVAKWSVAEEEFYDDFYGLVQALLSTKTNCLNDPNSNLIFEAVENAYYNKKRGDAVPILHCLTSSIKGGNMTSVTNTANSNLRSTVYFYLEAEILEDETVNPNRMFLYMYYADSCTRNDIGKTILVCKQVLSRDENGIWYADGTYMGKSVVGYHYAGGQNGKEELTVLPLEWTWGAPEE